MRRHTTTSTIVLHIAWPHWSDTIVLWTFLPRSQHSRSINAFLFIWQALFSRWTPTTPRFWCTHIGKGRRPPCTNRNNREQEEWRVKWRRDSKEKRQHWIQWMRGFREERHIDRRTFICRGKQTGLLWCKNEKTTKKWTSYFFPSDLKNSFK